MGLDEQDMTIARSLCAAAAGDLWVCPEEIALDIASRVAWLAVTKPHGAKVTVPFAGDTTIAKLLAEAEKAHRAGR